LGQVSFAKAAIPFAEHEFSEKSGGMGVYIGDSIRSALASCLITQARDRQSPKTPCAKKKKS
jgi:hypothetical protein